MSTSTLKRFAVFSGDWCYPRGGWRDYQGSYDTLDEAVEIPTTGEWRHVVDLSTGQVFGIPIRDAKDAASVRCDECTLKIQRAEGGVHVDREYLGPEDIPCKRVFVVRAKTGWRAWVDGEPLRDDGGHDLCFTTATAAYASAQAAAPRRESK